MREKLSWRRLRIENLVKREDFKQKKKCTQKTLEPRWKSENNPEFKPSKARESKKTLSCKRPKANVTGVS